MDAVQAANSGHPGLPMGCATIAHVLFSKHLRFDPQRPDWANRDRFVLSAGHGSMLLYAMLHLTGYDLSLDELKNFRQWGSKTPGHPENHLTPGVEMATGPLGQGFATAVGMAIAERFLAANHHPIDHRTYVLCSDGDLMEGVAHEAASLAGHQGLDKLIVLYDDNGITIDGKTDIAFTDDTIKRFDALGWRTKSIDGMDMDSIDRALNWAKQSDGRPTFIACKTVIGFGSPNKSGTSKVHGAPLGEEELAATKCALDLPERKFWVPEEVYAHYAQTARRASDGSTSPAESSSSVDWEKVLPAFEGEHQTRKASQATLKCLGEAMPNLMGGCADLAESVFTEMPGRGHQSAEDPSGANIAFGVREHAMAAAVNGMNLHGGVRAFGGTFFIFSDYCKPSLRLAALMECPSIFVFSHDSIGVGEDGPTHQPIEQLAGLRAIPNFNLMRPADANETAVCWRIALESLTTPCAIVTTRQPLPTLAPPRPYEQVSKGAYVLAEASQSPRVILVATGSEVSLAVEAGRALEASGTPTRVVSMPSWFLFERQPEEYRASVLPQGTPTLSIEAGSTLGWARYAQAHIGIDHFGASAPYQKLMQEFGFTVEAVVKAVTRFL